MSRTSRIAGALFAVSVVGIGLVGCSESGPDTPGASGVADEIDTITLRATTTIGGPDNHNNTPMLAYLDAVEEASGGRITYEFLPAASVVQPADVGEAVSDGIVDIAMVAGGAYNPATHPIDNWIGQLAFYKVSGPPRTILEKDAAGLEWWWTAEEALQSDWIDNGLIPMTPHVTPVMSYKLLCKDPVVTLADANGKRVRTPGTAWADTLSSVGMIPVTLPGAEMYEALQRGLVDCVAMDTPDMRSSSVWEVAKHYTELNLPGFVSWGMFMSQGTWDRLSEATKDLLWRELTTFLEVDSSNAIALQQSFFTEADGMGVEIHAPATDLAQAVQEQQSGVIDQMKADAPATVTDPEALVDAYIAAHEKWAVTLEELGYESEDSWEQWVTSPSGSSPVDTSAFAERVMQEFLAQKRPE